MPLATSLRFWMLMSLSSTRSSVGVPALALCAACCLRRCCPRCPSGAGVGGGGGGGATAEDLRPADLWLPQLWAPRVWRPQVWLRLLLPRRGSGAQPWPRHSAMRVRRAPASRPCPAFLVFRFFPPSPRGTRILGRLF